MGDIKTAVASSCPSDIVAGYFLPLTATSASRSDVTAPAQAAGTTMYFRLGRAF